MPHSSSFVSLKEISIEIVDIATSLALFEKPAIRMSFPHVFEIYFLCLDHNECSEGEICENPTFLSSLRHPYLFGRYLFPILNDSSMAPSETDIPEWQLPRSLTVVDLTSSVHHSAGAAGTAEPERIRSFLLLSL